MESGDSMNSDARKPVHVNTFENRLADGRYGCLKRYMHWSGCLVTSSLVGVAVGFGVGFALYYAGAPGQTLMWIGLPGELYMRSLKAVILPLIISSIIAGTAGLEPKENGRVTMVALIYIVSTNIFGAVLGTVLAVIMRPGSAGTSLLDLDDTTLDTGNLQPSDLFADLIRNLFPDNLVSACFEKSQTRYKKQVSFDIENSTNTQYVRYLGTAGGTNILGLLTVCAAIGLAAARSGKEAKPFLAFFRSAVDIILRLVRWIVSLTPFAVVSLIAKSIGEATDVEGTFRGVGLYLLGVATGSLFLSCLFIPMLFLLFIRKNPCAFLASTARPVITVVSALSSAVAIPEIMTCLETHYKVDPRVSRFVVPLSSSINRSGSACFITLTSIYICQLQDKESMQTVVLLTMLAMAGSLTVPALPSASVVTILMILDSMGIPPVNIGIIMAMEWFSDRIRAVPNAVGHVMCGVLTWHFCKRSLAAANSEHASNGFLAMHEIQVGGNDDEEDHE